MVFLIVGTVHQVFVLVCLDADKASQALFDLLAQQHTSLGPDDIRSLDDSV